MPKPSVALVESVVSADRPGDQRLEDAGGEADAQHRSRDPGERLGREQEQDRGDVGEVGSDQDFLEPEPVRERARDDRDQVREEQEQALDDAELVAGVAQGGEVDPEPEVDAVVRVAFQQLDQVGDPEDRWELRALGHAISLRFCRQMMRSVIAFSTARVRSRVPSLSRMSLT